MAKTTKISAHFIYALLPKKLIDHIRSKAISIYCNGKPIFLIEDMGEITRYRGKTFETKEPETINWINSFDEGDNLLDVGANIGLYSLYAGIKGHNVIAIEPEGQNFCLLIRNISLNNLCSNVMAFPVALDEELSISELSLNRDGDEFGSALHSFRRSIDQYGKKFIPIRIQGVIGIELDKVVKASKRRINHIKIDVDGNEYLVLLGAKNTLSSLDLKSILIELDRSHPEYERSIELLSANGFTQTYPNKEIQEKFPEREISPLSTVNHIFTRR